MGTPARCTRRKRCKKVQRCSGTVVQRCSGAAVQRCSGATVQRCNGAAVRRCGGAAAGMLRSGCAVVATQVVGRRASEPPADKLRPRILRGPRNAQ
eukprot:scaffold5766_cov36-Phaeocystis_antarctica.AAC.2